MLINLPINCVAFDRSCFIIIFYPILSLSHVSSFILGTPVSIDTIWHVVFVSCMTISAGKDIYIKPSSGGFFPRTISSSLNIRLYFVISPVLVKVYDI